MKAAHLKFPTFQNRLVEARVKTESGHFFPPPSSSESVNCAHSFASRIPVISVVEFG